MADHVTILGVTGAASAASIHAAMAALPGPPLIMVPEGAVVLVVQSASADVLHTQGRDAPAALKALNAMQRRLEAACMNGPFLAADPARAVCPAADLPRLLNDAAPPIAAALREYGAIHQWDVVLRWQPEPVVAARRDEIAASLTDGGGAEALAAAVQAALARECSLRGAALAACVSRVAVATREGAGGATEVSVTVLLGRGHEALLEHALGSLPDPITRGAEADLRGPLPPVSFAALRLDSTAPADLGAAWAALALPAEVDAAGLRRHWRQAASRLHPDHGGLSDGPMTAAGSAYRLLRDLIPQSPGTAPCTLASLQNSAGLRLRVELTGLAPPSLETVPTDMPGVEMAA